MVFDNLGDEYRTCAECGDRIDVRDQRHVWMNFVESTGHASETGEYYFCLNCWVDRRADWDDPDHPANGSVDASR
jgi:hypothetical protein